MISTESYETITFFGLAALFEILERFRPAVKTDRWLHWKSDALSFTFAILMSRISKHLVAGPTGPYALTWTFETLQHLPGAVRIFLAIVVADFILYWIHRAQHGFTPLWRTHAWHHSVQELYWFSGFRTSFLHSLIYNVPQVVVPTLLFHLSPFQIAIAYSIGLFIQFWEHTNLDVNIGLLRHVVITPVYHRVHHSVDHNQSNFAATFSLWDRLFGTYCDPSGVPADTQLGLGEPFDRQRATRMLAGV
jgi:sterol desaturase/sphingolipid hydroxylase (fatty acid hydroxylase superfamily)